MPCALEAETVRFIEDFTICRRLAREPAGSTWSGRPEAVRYAVVSGEGAVCFDVHGSVLLGASPPVGPRPGSRSRDCRKISDGRSYAGVSRNPPQVAASCWHPGTSASDDTVEVSSDPQQSHHPRRTSLGRYALASPKAWRLCAALSVTPVVAGQTADKSMTVFVTASEPTPQGKPKAQFGNKRDKWPVVCGLHQGADFRSSTNAGQRLRFTCLHVPDVQPRLRASQSPPSAICRSRYAFQDAVQRHHFDRQRPHAICIGAH